ncbi:MAG: aspartate racemase [Candidatus Azotimanducaceae bacterium]|jgi:aspartate racemase
MKTIGLIGGITPESTVLYYRILNDLAQKEFGRSSSSKVIINSMNFEEIQNLLKAGRWDLLNVIMSEAGKSLESAGADYILICANTMHLCIEAVKKAVSIPVIHIAEATAKEITNSKLNKVALLGTKYTMENTFFTDILKKNALDTIIPNQDDRQIIHDVIYDELALGILNDASKKKYINIIQKLIKQGAEGIILGCTEIPLLIEQEDVSVPIFDTTKIHATEVFKLAIN